MEDGFEIFNAVDELEDGPEDEEADGNEKKIHFTVNPIIISLVAAVILLSVNIFFCVKLYNALNTEQIAPVVNSPSLFTFDEGGEVEYVAQLPTIEYDYAVIPQSETAASDSSVRTHQISGDNNGSADSQSPPSSAKAVSSTAVESAASKTEAADKSASQAPVTAAKTPDTTAAAVSEPPPVQTDSGLININTATLEELTALNGIGEVKAQAIIDYRNENGYFNSIEEITNVSGIGEKTYEKNKNLITVD